MDVYIIHIKKFDGGHLGFGRWPKINSVHRLDNTKTILKFVVDWENSFTHNAFTGIYNF